MFVCSCSYHAILLGQDTTDLNNSTSFCSAQITDYLRHAAPEAICKPHDAATQSLSLPLSHVHIIPCIFKVICSTAAPGKIERKSESGMAQQ